MADGEQLDLLRKGVADWNSWRDHQGDQRIDLREADSATWCWWAAPVTRHDAYLATSLTIQGFLVWIVCYRPARAGGQ
jgi:hypothetical protein